MCTKPQSAAGNSRTQRQCRGPNTLGCPRATPPLSMQQASTEVSVPVLHIWTPAPLRQQAPKPTQPVTCSTQKQARGAGTAACPEWLDQPEGALCYRALTQQHTSAPVPMMNDRAAAGNHRLQVWQGLSAVLQSFSAVPAQLMPTTWCVATACSSSRTADSICGAKASGSPVPLSSPEWVCSRQREAHPVL